MPRSVFIVRHGNTFDKGDVVTRVGARTDLPLSNSGQEQARALARQLADENFQAAYCSPLQRTQQTSRAIIEEQEAPVRLTLVDFLREIDYGPDENAPEDKVIARIGRPALDLWETQAIPPNGWDVDPAFLVSSWSRLFSEIAADCSTDAPVLVVTSNGVARFALHAAGADSDSHNLKLKTGAYGVVDVHNSPTRNTSPICFVRNWGVRP